jgi:hypothetical protein
MLNRDLDMKDKIYLVNPNYLQTKINALMAIPGEIGFTIRMGLFTGLILIVYLVHPLPIGQFVHNFLCLD